MKSSRSDLKLRHNDFGYQKVSEEKKRRRDGKACGRRAICFLYYLAVAYDSRWSGGGLFPGLTRRRLRASASAARTGDPAGEHGHGHVCPIIRPSENRHRDHMDFFFGFNLFPSITTVTRVMFAEGRTPPSVVGLVAEFTFICYQRHGPPPGHGTPTKQTRRDADKEKTLATSRQMPPKVNLIYPGFPTLGPRISDHAVGSTWPSSVPGGVICVRRMVFPALASFLFSTDGRRHG